MELIVIVLMVLASVIIVAGILFALVAPFVAARREATIRERDGLTKHDVGNYRGPGRTRTQLTRDGSHP